MKRSIIFFGIILAASTILGIGETVLAQTAVDYPIIGGDVLSLDTEVPRYIRYIFLFGLGVAGISALGILLFGALQYVASAGNPGQQGEAKNWMWAAISGLLVLLASWLILNTINPDLVSLSSSTGAPPPPTLETSEGACSACIQNCVSAGRSMDTCLAVCDNECEGSAGSSQIDEQSQNEVASVNSCFGNDPATTDADVLNCVGGLGYGAICDQNVNTGESCAFFCMQFTSNTACNSVCSPLLSASVPFNNVSAECQQCLVANGIVVEPAVDLTRDDPGDNDNSVDLDKVDLCKCGPPSANGLVCAGQNCGADAPAPASGCNNFLPLP